ncbi:Golgin subfamily A member 5 [Phytophthora cinnamomi]|uniref:Golgin subfamily A member 5 n=1 Tax=Phytophthora cinnamomi TaxID=4785 RepID=UPI00355ACA04|nr:Golgin subfamily A member 5 [Phytophthora cinnamomi]
MNWVSSSLELAGSLLESVDQQAALTLAGTEEDEEEDAGLLSTARMSQSSEGNASSAAENEEPENSPIEEAPVSTDGASSSSSSQAKTTVSGYTKSTPPLSGSGNKLAGFVSAISTQLENVSSGRGGDPPLSSSGSQSASTEEYSRLHKELARVKNELRLKEKQLSSTQKSMQICEEELVALEQECKEKIAQVQHEMSVMQQDKNSDEQNFIQALELKDNQARAMKADLDALTEAKAQYTTEIASLKAELAKAVESKDTLWTSAASANNESEQLIESLRSELKDTLAAMNNLKREYAESKNTMFSRQSQLESTNTELVNNVANLERELAKAREAASAASQTTSGGVANALAGSGPAHFGTNTNFASMNDDYRRVQQTLVLTKKSLHDESRKNEVQKQEIITLTEEVRRLKQALEVAQESFSKQLEATVLENEQLKEQVKQLASHTSAAAAASGELRIQRLTNRLIEKQETIDSLRSRVTTMDVRLQDVQLRAQRAEEKLARMEQNGGIDDMEMATPIGKPGRGGMRSRSNRMVHMISRVAPVVERSHRVVTALDVLDRWLLFLGRVFLQAPFARLGMLCYVVLIHFWVFMILSFHTSHLTEEMQLSTAAENAVIEPGEDMIPGGVGH